MAVAVAHIRSIRLYMSSSVIAIDGGNFLSAVIERIGLKTQLVKLRSGGERPEYPHP